MNKGYFLDNYTNYLNCRIKAVYELLLFSGVKVSPHLLSLLFQDSNAYFTVINYKGIEIPVFSSLHPRGERNIIRNLQLQHEVRRFEDAKEISELVKEGIPVLVSYDADALSRRARNRNFGIISATVLWDYHDGYFISTRKENSAFATYQEDMLSLAMKVETQPIAANGEGIYILPGQTVGEKCEIDALIRAINENLCAIREGAMVDTSRNLPECNCVEGALAFTQMRQHLQKLSRTIITQPASEVARRMFILSTTIILKVLEKNGYGFQSFRHCFWLGYQEFLDFTGRKADELDKELETYISKKWIYLMELLLSNREYSVDYNAIEYFFDTFNKGLSDIEKAEKQFFSNVKVMD